MAVAVIVLSVISVFAVGIAVMVFQPALYDLAYVNSFWDDTNVVHQDILILRDTLYNASIAIPIAMLAVVGIWAYLAINRRDDL